MKELVTNPQLTKNQKIALSTKEIAKRIRTQLKAEFRSCKFSVRTEYYSMGCSITVRLMKASIRIKKRLEEIGGYALAKAERNHYTKDQILSLQNEAYHQLNEFTLRRDFDADYWCNGVFLTEEGHAFLKRVVEIADQYNYDDSDSQTDYYSVNFSFHLSLGRWDKPFIDGNDLKPKKVDWSNEVFQI